jgi:hypothetical protein
MNPDEMSLEDFAVHVFLGLAKIYPAEFFLKIVMS